MAKSNTAPKNETASKAPTHVVYVVEGEGDSAFWTKIGAAWPHKDGKGFNIQLSAAPLNGRLTVREFSEKQEG